MNIALQSTPQTKGRKLKDTTTRCTTCFKECPGEVWLAHIADKPNIVSMLHKCPEHGNQATLISSDARFYWLAQGDRQTYAAEGAGVGTLGGNARKAGGFYDQLASCITLIEVVDSCNLPCPTCFSASPIGKHEHVKARPLDDLKQRIEMVLRRKGGIEMLQLSGGEPTLHPELIELLAWAGAKPEIEYIFLNTNGVRFASDQRFVEEFASRFPRRKVMLYLQFDGVQEAGQRELRGMDLRRMREKVLTVCDTIGLPVLLVMTTTPANLPYAYETVEFGLAHRNVRAVNFQPAFVSGRTPASWSKQNDRPVTTADILTTLIKNSNGFLSAEDFTPLPCGDPNCQTIGCILRQEGKPRVSMRHFIDAANMQDFLHDKLHYDLAALAKCGCDNNQLAELLKHYALTEADAFFIAVKPFMDARTWDKDRTDRCCTHVITPSGRLESFCRYYSGFPDISVQ